MELIEDLFMHTANKSDNPSSIYRMINKRNLYIEMVAQRGKAAADAAFKPAMMGPKLSPNLPTSPLWK